MYTTLPENGKKISGYLLFHLLGKNSSRGEDFSNVPSCKRWKYHMTDCHISYLSISI